MKQLLLLLFIGLLSHTVHAQGVQIKDNCDLKVNKAQAKEALSPYKTLYSKTYKITHKKYDQIKEFKINLLGSQAYRMVVNLQGIPLNVRVLITDRERTHKKAKTLLDEDSKEVVSLNVGAEGDEFDPSRVYVTLFIPAAEDIDPKVLEKSCINFIYGTKVQ